MDKRLKPGDPCPCCGQPIQTSDPDRLLFLSWLAWRRGRGTGLDRRINGDNEP